MKHQPEENQSVENVKNSELTKNQESSKIEEAVKSDELESFQEFEEDKESSGQIQDTDTEENILQKQDENLIDSSVAEAFVSDNIEQNVKLQTEEEVTEKSDITEEKELSQEKEDTNKKLSFSERRKKRRERKLFERQRKVYIFLKTGTNWLSFVPFIILIVCLPWISYMVSPDSLLKIAPKWSGATPTDYLLYQKSLWLLLILPLFVLFGLLYQRKMERKKDIILTLAFLFLTGYSVLVIVSAVLSRYTEISFWGAEEQREGMFVLIGYVVLCLTAVSLYRKEKDYKVIFWSLSVLTGILILFLVANTTEYDFYNSVFLQGWKQSSAFDEISSEVFQSMELYALTLHYTELGTLCSLLLPFFTVMAIFVKEKNVRVVSIVMAVCSCILLFFSMSRAGVAGVFVAFSVLLVTCVRKWLIHYKQTLGVIAVFMVFCAGAGIATNGEIFSKGIELRQDFYSLFQNQENFDYHKDIPIKQVAIDGKRLFFTMQQEVLELDYTTGAVNCFDKEGQFVEFQKGDGVRYMTTDSRFADISFATEIIKTMDREKEEKRKVLRLYYQDKQIFIVNLAGLPQKAFLDTQYKNLDIVEAPYFGFEGKEKSANNRGYVWSRTIPLLRERLWIGSGAGSFSKEFPQGDVLAKWYVYGTPNITINEANNWYLQTGVEHGLLALLIWIVVLFFYFVDSFTLYIFRKEYNATEIFGLAIFVALVGYSVNTFFVSTSISVAPLFWCLFGFGMGANYWVRRMREQKMFK